MIWGYVDTVNCLWNVIDLCESGRAGRRRRQGFGRQEGWEEVQRDLEDEASEVNRIQMWFAVDAIQRWCSPRLGRGFESFCNEEGKRKKSPSSRFHMTWLHSYFSQPGPTRRPWYGVFCLRLNLSYNDVSVCWVTELIDQRTNGHKAVNLNLREWINENDDDGVWTLITDGADDMTRGAGRQY